ncbi:MAG: DUF512 domain-containing protein [Clostridia bacterium]|nr:DUF512 domain-containing protein [Clostridia bacterium]
MGAKIISVDCGSPADRAKINAGEILLSIDGHTIRDVLDYKFYSYEQEITLTLDTRCVTIKKGEGEDLGLNFETYLMDKQKRCANKCIFCFIDQLPPNMRETLYFKDDDARMSFLMGNYISLTNLSEDDIERLITMRLSPINISVQATDPDVRRLMLGNPRAGECMNIMRRFAEAKLTLNCQLVICPGVNDGAILQKSLDELIALAPSVNSISVVPVGITKYREGLYPLTPVDKVKAAEILDMVNAVGDKCVEKYGTRIVYCGDELYIKAERKIPDSEFYEEFPQLENGVGMMALLEDEWSAALRLMDECEISDFTIATGTSAAPFMSKLIDELSKKCDNRFRYKVIAVENKFFGDTVNVAGLVTGGDLISALDGNVVGERVFIPDVMLRHKTNVFLDDVTIDDVEKSLGVKVIPTPSDGFELLDLIIGE